MSKISLAAAGFQVDASINTLATEAALQNGCCFKTPTPTIAPTPTPTSCRGDLPVVEPVMSPTDLLEQTIYVCGRIAGSSSISVCGEAGCAPEVVVGGVCTLWCNPLNSSCNSAVVPLLPNQTNHIIVCQNNGTCPVGGCVEVDGNGRPLEIVQVQTATATPTATTGTPDTTIRVGDASGPPGAVGITVEVSTSAAITVGATDLNLTFDPGVLEVTAASSSTLSSFTWSVDNVAGVVRTTSARATGDDLGPDGVLFSVTFSVKDTAPLGASSLDIVDSDGVPPDDLSGVAPPIPLPAIVYDVIPGIFMVVGTPTPSPSYTPTPTPTHTPTNTRTPTATFTPTKTRTWTYTPTKTWTPSFTATETPTLTSTPTGRLTPTATTTPSPTATETPTFSPTPSQPGDVDGNGVIDAADLEALIAAVFVNGANPVADVNGDERVGAADFPALVELISSR